jgi:hypothetical protein
MFLDLWKKGVLAHGARIALHHNRAIEFETLGHYLFVIWHFTLSSRLFARPRVPPALDGRGDSVHDTGQKIL